MDSRSLFPDLDCPDLITPGGDRECFIHRLHLRLRQAAQVASDADVATVNGTIGGAPYEIPLGDVEKLWLEQNELSRGKTAALLGALGGFFAVAIVGMIRQGRNNEGS